MNDNPKFMELEKRLNTVKAKDMMSRSVLTVKKEMTLASLAAMILEKKVSGVPVVDDAGRLSGIVTATDLFSLMYMIKTGQMAEDGQHGVCNPTVDFAMSKDVLSVQEESTLLEIMNIMRGRNIHTLPVTNGGNLIGIIGRRDVLKHFYSIVGEFSSNK